LSRRQAILEQGHAGIAEETIPAQLNPAVDHAGDQAEQQQSQQQQTQHGKSGQQTRG
jgi:hypothetical protein